MSQVKFIKKYLLLNKSISRNHAIYQLQANGHHITRLGAIINVLRHQGMKIKTEWKYGDNDCIYKLEN